jgi:orotate phosphoribosyltransferase-like protein
MYGLNTEKNFNSEMNINLEEMRDLHGRGFSVTEIAEKVNLSEHLVSSLVERFVMRWDHYSGLPSPSAYED